MVSAYVHSVKRTIGRVQHRWAGAAEVSYLYTFIFGVFWALQLSRNSQDILYHSCTNQSPQLFFWVSINALACDLRTKALSGEVTSLSVLALGKVALLHITMQDNMSKCSLFLESRFCGDGIHVSSSPTSRCIMIIMSSFSSVIVSRFVSIEHGAVGKV